MPGFEPLNPEYASVVRASFAKQGLMRALGIELVAVEPGRCVLRAPFHDRVAQQQRYFHGALVGAALDSAGGYSALTLMPADSEVLTTEYKINFLAAAAGNELTADGRVLRPGRTLTVTEAHAYVQRGDARKLCAVMLQSLIRVPLGA